MDSKKITTECFFVFSDFSRSTEYEEILIRLSQKGVAVKCLYLAPLRDSSFISFIKVSGLDASFCTCKSNFRRFLFLWKNLHINPKQRLIVSGSLAGYLCLPIVLLKRYHYTLVRHHGDLHRKIRYLKFRALDKLVAKFADSVVAISQTHRQLLCQEEGMNDEKVIVCHGGFEVQRYFDARLQVKTSAVEEIYSGKIFGVLSRLVDWKGVNFIVDAFQMFLLSGGEGKLLIVGDGPLRGLLAKSIKRENRQKVIFIDYIEDALEFYRSIDVFIHVPIGKFAESFGMVYLESIACGKPGIFTRSGIASELVGLDEFAIFVEFQDAASIASAMAKISKPEISHKLKKAPLTFFNDFTYEALANRYEHIIETSTAKYYDICRQQEK